MSVTTHPNSAEDANLLFYIIHVSEPLHCTQSLPDHTTDWTSSYATSQYCQECFSCLNCWTAATDRCHCMVSICCMLLYRVFLTGHISCNATHFQCCTIRPYYMWMCCP